ncbi:hypothetical protein SALBM311S_04091 [Streptomyces alboniger]
MNSTQEQASAPAGWLVTGAGGMLGQDVLAALAAEGEPSVALDRAALDLTDPAAVRQALERHRPAVVVNCAAWTAVDDAETREDEARRINGDGPAHLADACARTGAAMLMSPPTTSSPATPPRRTPRTPPPLRAARTAAPSSPASRPS